MSQRFLQGQEHPHRSLAEDEIYQYILLRPNVVAVRDVRPLNLPWSFELATKRGIQHIAIRTDFESSSGVLNLPFEREYHLLGHSSGWKGDPLVSPGIGTNPAVDTLLYYVRNVHLVYVIRREVFRRYVDEQERQGVTFGALQYPQGAGGIRGALVPVHELHDAKVIADEWHMADHDDTIPTGGD